MTSIQDVANAAHRLNDEAKTLAHMSLMCSDTVNRHSLRLYAIVRGSTSGEQAVRQIGIASQSIRDSAVKMQALDSAVQAFISDLTK